MKRSLLLILALMCGIYLVLTIVKGDDLYDENPVPLEEDWSEYSDGYYVDV